MFPVADLLGASPFTSLGVLYALAAASMSGSCGLTDGLLNLRRGPWRSAVVQKQKARVCVTHAASLSAALLLIAAALWQHGRGLAQDVEAFEKECRVVWADLFPDSTPPIDVEARLVSEHEREMGIRGGGQVLPQADPALGVLRDVVAELPTNVPLKIAQLDISDKISVISGEARSHGEVEQVAAQLGKVDRVTVQPATTERTHEGTVRFTVRFERGEHEQG
jgi:hypothetical protein